MTTFGGVDVATSLRLEQLYSKLNYDVIDAQANISDHPHQPSEPKRIRSANESKARFRGVVEAMELAETGSKPTSEELKFKIFFWRGMPPDPPSKCVQSTHILSYFNMSLMASPLFTCFLR